MLELTPSVASLFAALCDWSRTHCVAICAFLVPANLLATAQTLLFVGLDRPLSQIRLITAIASLYALVMVLHVGTWFIIGVVMIPTFVLLWLGTTCLSVNVWAIAHPSSLFSLLKWLTTFITHQLRPITKIECQ